MVEGPQTPVIRSNDITKLNQEKLNNYLPNKTGGIVDDLIVYQLKLMVVNASNIDKDWKWIFNQFKVDISNISDKTSLLAIQGPKAIEAMQPLCDTDLKNLKNYCHTTTSFAGFKNILVATTGYTGSGGIEIYFNPEYAETIWESIMNAGADYGISPIGLAARDTLRIEMGYCLYGNEINDTTSNAGLNWVTKTNTNFINYKNYEVSIQNQSDKKLIGLK